LGPARLRRAVGSEMGRRAPGSRRRLPQSGPLPKGPASTGLPGRGLFGRRPRQGRLRRSSAP